MEREKIDEVIETVRNAAFNFAREGFGNVGQGRKMLLKFLHHVKLVWRLQSDGRVSPVLKSLFVWIPAVYLFIPINLLPDVIPVIGLLDDFFLLLFTSLVFVQLVPHSIRQEHYEAITHVAASRTDSIEKYRYPAEDRDLAFGFIICLIALIVAGSGVGLVILGFFALSYVMTMLYQSRLLSDCLEITEHQYTELHETFQAAKSHLPEVNVRLLVQQHPQFNAYALGYHEPYSIVLHSALVEKLSSQELQAIIGHEIGHILFHHMQLMSIISASRNILANMVFLKWKRSCEYSCDAVGWLATGKDTQATLSALLKISTGITKTPIDVERFIQQTSQVDDSLGELSDLLADHPMIKKRVLRILQLAKQEDAE